MKMRTRTKFNKNIHCYQIKIKGVVKKSLVIKEKKEAYLRNQLRTRRNHHANFQYSNNKKKKKKVVIKKYIDYSDSCS